MPERTSAWLLAILMHDVRPRELGQNGGASGIGNITALGADNEIASDTRLTECPFSGRGASDTRATSNTRTAQRTAIAPGTPGTA